MIPISPPGFPNIDQNANTVVIFESINDQNKGEQWKRTGFCNRCGNCCDDPENIFQTIDGNFQPIAEPLPQVVPGKCAYFRWSEDGLAMCTGRDTLYYKQGCAFAPSKPEHVVNWPDCSYKFEKIKDAS